MKKNIKFIMAGIAVLSALSITACGGNKADNKAESKTESPVASTVESTAERANNEDMNGTYDGSIYTNKVFNIKFDAKSVNMEMVSTEDLSDMQKKTHDDTLKMYAHDTANSSSVLFGLVNITSDLKAYIDGNIAKMNKDNEGAGDIKAESTTIKFWVRMLLV